MDAAKLSVVIDTQATGDGARKAGQDVASVASAAKSAAPAVAAVGKSSKEMADGLGKSVAVGTATTQLLQNLGQVGQGGAAGMFAFGRSILAFGQVIKAVLVEAGPIGWAIAALGLLAGAAFALRDAFKPAGESVEQFKERIAGLDKATLKQLEATVSALTDRLKGAKDEADALRAAMDKVDDAEMGAKLAANKASGLNPKEQEKQDFLIRDEFKKRREAREQQAAELARDQAAEKRKTLAPEFDDARDKYADLLKEKDRIDADKAELDRLIEKNRGQYKAGPEGETREQFMARAAERDATEAKIREIRERTPKADERTKFDTELESAKKRFEGSDGNGGISKEYQAAAAEAMRAEKALQLLLKTRKDVAEWEKAQVKIENGGVDPRDAEIAARKSPGKARIVGPDGQVKEYEVRADPTANQQISAAAEAAKNGQPPPALANQITQGKLAPGSDNTANTGPNSLKPLVDSVKAAGGPMDAAATALQEAAGAVLPDFEPAATAAQTIAASLKEAADTELPDFTPAAEAAAALATTVSTYASTNAEFASTTTSALSATATVVSDHDKSIGALKSEMKTIQSQMSALRSKVK